MPSSMIHYCIENKILETVNLDRNLFIIGNLAPDAHNKTSEGRCESHFQRKSTCSNDISAFKNKYMTGNYNDFILGYYCHLIADTISYNNFNCKYLQGVSEGEKTERLKMCYSDYKILNRILIENFHFTKQSILIPKVLCVKEIETEKLSGIINEFQSNFKYESCKEKLSILDIEIVLNEIDDVAKKCVEDIRCLRNTKKSILFDNIKLIKTNISILILIHINKTMGIKIKNK